MIPQIITPTPIIAPNQFNGRVDADSIMASLARTSGQTLKCDGGVTYYPMGSVTVKKPIGTIVLPSGVMVKSENFFKITLWQDDYARRLVKFLNYELHHDGVWAVMWLNPTIDGYATEIRMAYQDEDGDTQFVVESQRPLVDLQQVDDVRSHGNNCESAYHQYKNFLNDVDVQDNQKIQAAKGEQPKDPNDQPLL